MTTETEIISWVSYPTQGSRKVFFVTYNNRVLGDSRGYSSVDEVYDAAIKAVDNAGSVNGVRNAVYRPGYHKAEAK